MTTISASKGALVAACDPSYVGWPLAVEFGKLGRTIGLEIVEAKGASSLAKRGLSREILDAVIAIESTHGSRAMRPF